MLRMRTRSNLALALALTLLGPSVAHAQAPVTSGAPSAEEVEAATKAGLRWLARHQDEGGSWRGAPAGKECAGAGDPRLEVHVTALAALAYLGLGYTPFSRETYVDDHLSPPAERSFGAAVKKALDFLLKQQGADGRIGPDDKDLATLDHAAATLALAEVFGVTEGAKWKAPAESALTWLVRTQNKDGGFPAGPGGKSDVEATGWSVMALKSAQIAQLGRFDEPLAAARGWLDAAAAKGAKDGRTVKGKNDAWAAHPTTAAIAAYARIFASQKAGDAATAKAAEALLKDLPTWDDAKGKADRKVDGVYWYAGSIALFQAYGPKGEQWTRWNAAIWKELAGHQKSKVDGCADGSWDPAVDRAGFRLGRAGATALDVMDLEITARYVAIGAMGEGK
jgi:hypothetical protein